MKKPTPHTDILSAVNHAVSLGQGRAPEPDKDPEQPLHTHHSHGWVVAPGGRWMACARCGLRDYWPGCASPCKIPKSKATAVTLGEALLQLAADLDAFAVWWREQGEPDVLPHIDEWAANFHEWRIAR